ncbi:MAG: VWA domain-containing protein [Armatimonadota bacterium]|nr:VWA domain-containing protein [Armatimonadota bacterium]
MLKLRTTTPRHARSSSTPAPTTSSLPLFLGVALALGTLTAGYLFWPSRHKAGPPPAQTDRPALNLLVGVDVSSSTSLKLRQQFCGVLFDAVDTVLPRETPTTVFLYDKSARIDFGPQKLQDSNDLINVAQRIQAYKSGSRGTRQSVILEKMLGAARQAESRGEQTVCLLLTDGEDEDPVTTKKLSGQLAALGGLKAVLVAGTSTEATIEHGHRMFLRDKLEQAMAPLENKYRVCGQQDIAGGLARFRELIQRR